MTSKKVTGYQIRTALEEAKLVLATVSDQFTDCLYKFDDEEDKKPPKEVIEAIRAAEHRVAQLQALQEKYNQTVTVSVDGCSYTLALAIKMRGYASRIEAQWKQATRNQSPERRYYREDPLKRSKEDVYAKRTISKDDAITEAKKAGRWTNALKNAIAQANLVEIHLELDFDL
jgi:hypothetical protein